MANNTGILGLGVYIPPEVRHNDWWSADVVASWQKEREAAARPVVPANLTDGMRRVLQAMAAQSIDAFQGSVERSVLPSEMTVVDMEERAARAAIERAGIAPEQIDLLLTNTVFPDYLLSNSACTLHHRLALPRQCFSMHTDAASHAFMMQLSIAESMIASGRARHALIVQSCVPSRLLPENDPISPQFGDAATAAVVGPVPAGRGIEVSYYLTDGSKPKTLIASVPGARWYDPGRARLHVGDAQQAFEVFLETADACKEAVEHVLARSGHQRSEVDFLAIHQGAPWLREVVLEHLGLTARTVETYARTGYVFACAQPLALAIAQEQGLLHDGDLVLLVGGGPGTTCGAMLARWGS